jgi:hypothetical protein
VRVHFEQFETEKGADVLQIALISPDGNDEAHVARLSGNLQEGFMPDYVFPNVPVEFAFRSDASVQQPGFLADFERFTVSEENCVCPQFFYKVPTKKSITIKSPNYPKPPCKNIQCFYYLEATPDHSVKITIDELEIREGEDFVTVYDGNSTSDTNHVETIVESQKKDGKKKEITSKRHGLIILYSSKSENPKKGFSLTAEAVTGSCSCEHLSMSGSSGTFNSPGFPGMYCDRLDCNYTVEVPAGKNVKLKFFTLNLLSSDRLEIYDPRNMKQIVRSWWGRHTSVPRRSITMPGNKVIVRFKTQQAFSGIGIGFNATYEAIDRPNSCKCEGGYNIRNVSATSGSWSMEGCGPLDCFLLLYPPANSSQLEIKVDYVRLHANEDWLSIIRNIFQSGPVPSVVESLKGDHHKNRTIGVVTRGPVTVHYHMAEKYTSPGGGPTGFKMTYRWFSQQCGCGARQIKLTDENPVQFLSSPNYPRDYCHRMSCIYRITGGYGFKPTLTALDFATESVDTLGIYDGSQTSERKKIIVWRGSPDPDIPFPRIVGNETTLTVVFTTDGSVAQRGFNISIGRVSRYKTVSPLQCTLCQFYCTPTTTVAPNSSDTDMAQNSTKEPSPLPTPVPVLKQPLDVPYKWALTAGLLLGFLGGIIFSLLLLCLCWNRLILYTGHGKIQKTNRYVRQGSTRSHTYVENKGYDGSDTETPSTSNGSNVSNADL